MKRAARVVACALLLAPTFVHAQEDDEEFAELLDVISEETEVATKTRMNSDYVPGIVSVLDAQTLGAMGVRTVWDAMSFVPGVEAWLDPTGTPTVTVRGIPFPFNTGSIQVLVNSVPIAAEAAGINGAALLMPITLVERLEFVRGPGAVVYGDYAFQGLLNIVTRDQGSHAGLGIGSNDEREASLRASGAGEEWNASAQVARVSSDPARLPVGRDVAESRQYVSASLGRGDFSLVAQSVDRDLDQHDARNPPVVFDEASRSVEARYQHIWDSGLETRFRLQYLGNELRAANIDFDGGHREAGVDLIWRSASGQTWLGGVEQVGARIDDSETRVPPQPGRPPPPPRRLSDRERKVRSAYVQGQLPLTDSLQATLGARYDDNEAIGGRLTPRASLVWRIAENHILKAQYAEGYRTPTFFELYLDPAQAPLDFEVNRTAEINYVYQRPNTTARVTLFRSRIDDMVFRDFARQNFGNIAAARADGVEVDWSHQFGSTMRVDGALTWVDSEHNRNPPLDTVDIGAAANWFGNLGLLWTPRGNTAVGMRWTHVGSRDLPLEGASGYDRIDLALTRRHLFREGVEWQVGVQNALDERVVYVFPGPNSDNPIPYDQRIVYTRIGIDW